MNIPRSLVIKHTELDPSYIPLAYRREVLERDNKACHFCQESTDYLCHDLAKCRGGQTTPDNLLTCCVTCRREKGEFTAAEYFEVRLKEENIFKEATSVLIKVFYISGRSRVGEVEAEPNLNSPEFYMKVGHNGKRVKVNTANVEDIEILGGREKK